MPDEGTMLEMAALIQEEKRLGALIADLDARLEQPEARLAKAEALLAKAQKARDDLWAAVQPLRSDRILHEGDVARIRDKRSKLRVASRVADGKGIRPGTGALVEQLDELAGDKAQADAKKAKRALEVESALADMKARLDDE